MARSRLKIPTGRDPDKLDRAIRGYLREQGFVPSEEEDDVWQRGNGLLLGPQFLRLKVREGQVRLEAWVKVAILPHVFVGEFPLEGPFLRLPRSQLRRVVAEIEEMAG